MKIKEITIENFRSYYGANVFRIADGLTLIIGSNGDGKSTFYDALDWLMDTTGKNKMDLKYISKKRLSELSIGEADSVRVSMIYELNGQDRMLERSFSFTREKDGATTKDFQYNLLITTTEGRTRVDAFSFFERDFKSDVRQYSMFKGEEDLDVLNNPHAASYLIETFSKVKDYEPFIDFLNFAVEKADAAADHMRTMDRRNAKRSQQLISQRNEAERTLNDLRQQLKDADRNYEKYSEQLDNLEKNRESSELLKKCNDTIAGYVAKKNSFIGRIKDWYTFRLLDDMWILRGFEPIAREFQAKVAELSKERRRQEKAYDKATAVKDLFDQNAPKDYIPLAVHVPDEKTMREMLEDEVCKVCGRAAPKGSEAYIFMQHRLETFLQSLKPKQDDEDDELFPNQYIQELAKRETTLNDHLSAITTLGQRIDDEIAFDNRMRKKVQEYNDAIAKEEDLKQRILAQANSLSEDDLKNVYTNINNWWALKNQASNKRVALQPQIKQAEDKLKEIQDELDNLSKESVAEKMVRTSKAFHKIQESLNIAKEAAKQNFIEHLQNETNRFLTRLNKNDFTGSAKIITTSSGDLRLKLLDIDGTQIMNPNTALETTMYMALLFAISKLSEKRNNNEIPLIFDAPTSSFTAAKESSFFNIISELDKQVIIVTKSFLNETPDGMSVLDTERTSTINGRIYRIEKKRPFNDKDLSTIETIITPIKM